MFKLIVRFIFLCQKPHQNIDGVEFERISKLLDFTKIYSGVDKRIGYIADQF